MSQKKRKGWGDQKFPDTKRLLPRAWTFQIKNTTLQAVVQDIIQETFTPSKIIKWVKGEGKKYIQEWILGASIEEILKCYDDDEVIEQKWKDEDNLTFWRRPTIYSPDYERIAKLHKRFHEKKVSKSAIHDALRALVKMRKLRTFGTAAKGKVIYSSGVYGKTGRRLYLFTKKDLKMLNKAYTSRGGYDRS